MTCDAGSGFRRCFDYWLIRVLRHPTSPPGRRVSPSVYRTWPPMMRFYGRTSQLTARFSLPRRFYCFWMPSLRLLFAWILLAPVYVPWKAPLSGCLRNTLWKAPTLKVTSAKAMRSFQKYIPTEKFPKLFVRLARALSINRDQEFRNFLIQTPFCGWRTNVLT